MDIKLVIINASEKAALQEIRLETRSIQESAQNLIVRNIKYVNGYIVMLEFKTVIVSPPKDCNVIVGMAHFVKTAEDLYEALVNAAPNIRFGLGFCESSGPCLVRHEGNDDELRRLAAGKAFEIGCGHSFIIFVKNAYPINLLDKVKAVPEACGVLAATANPLEVIIAETEQGRGIVGVVDGFKSKGIETAEDVEERRVFLRRIGYKLG